MKRRNKLNTNSSNKEQKKIFINRLEGDDILKDKIMIFIIGVLVGAVLATGAFFIYTKLSSNNAISNQTQQIPSGNPPEMPNGEKPDEEPPEKPSGESDNQEEKSSDSTSKKSHSKKSISDTTESN